MDESRIERRLVEIKQDINRTYKSGTTIFKTLRRAKRMLSTLDFLGEMSFNSRPKTRQLIIHYKEKALAIKKEAALNVSVEMSRRRSTAVARKQGQHETFDCHICYLEWPARSKKKLSCEHSFCLRCIQRWRTNSDSCPYCRGRMDRYE